VQKKYHNGKIVNYISESFEELKSNMTWPEWPEVQRLTIVVAIFLYYHFGNMGVDEFCISISWILTG
jgi:preprotein translocase subunit SecE